MGTTNGCSIAERSMASTRSEVLIVISNSSVVEPPSGIHGMFAERGRAESATPHDVDGTQWVKSIQIEP
jgi:hypothetical protein